MALTAVQPYSDFLPRNEREPGMPVLGDVMVDLTQPPIEADGMRMTTLGDGTIDVDFEPGVEDAPPVTEEADDHYANLAAFLDHGALNKIAQDVCEMVDQDKASRSSWQSRMARGMKMIGLVGNDSDPVKGESKVVHPLLAEAIVQFQSRALRELFPSTGPAKATIAGKKTGDRAEQAERVKDYLNYQSVIEDKDYQSESDRMLFLLPFEGSVFRKAYNDPLTGKNVRRMVRAEHFIVPYTATSLNTTPRYTHQLNYSQDEMKRLQESSFFLKTPLSIPGGAASASNEYDIAKDRAEGKENPDQIEQDREHVVYETSLFMTLPGFEREDGLAQPYIVTVERDSQKVLAVRRGWVEDGDEFERDVNFSHYVFIRGDGFYGYGIIHLAGGLGDAATDLLQTILDSAAFSGLQSGFKSKDAKLKGDVSLKPGLWIDTEMTAEELGNAFHSPPFRDVPMSLTHILGALVEAGQRFVSTTEATIGDASNTGPVGTTVALIEQGSKVHTAIHSRLHVTLGQELRYLADLNGRYLPQEGYPYDVGGDSKIIYQSDFDGRVDVIPVSDPNIFSQTQRIAIAQTQVQLADAAPELVDRKVAYRRMFEAIGAYDIDELMPDKTQIERCDPVTENALAMMGRPIKAFMDQDHDAHIAVHFGELQLRAAQNIPGIEAFQQLIMAHLQEHMALNHTLKMAQMIGMPLPPINMNAKPGEATVQQLPPQLENMIAVKSAQAMQQLLQQMAQAQQAQAQPDPQAEQQAEDAKMAAEMKRKDAAAMADEKRKDMKAMAEVDRQDAKSGIDPGKVKEAEEFLTEMQIPPEIMTPRRLAVTSRELGKPFADTLELLMGLQSAGQGAGPAPIAAGMDGQL